MCIHVDPPESRSVQRRKALMKGEPMPAFDPVKDTPPTREDFDEALLSGDVPEGCGYTAEELCAAYADALEAERDAANRSRDHYRAAALREKRAGLCYKLVHLKWTHEASQFPHADKDTRTRITEIDEELAQLDKEKEND